jgi:Ca2+-binding RTX toxin-like protein
MDGSLAGSGDGLGDTFVGIETVAGGWGADWIRGDAAANILRGGLAADTLEGMAGNDVLIGDGDNDRLLGGTGNDSLVGGSGNDAFVFAMGDSAVDSTRDRIGDFATTRDRLVLSPIDANELLAGDQAFVPDLDGSFSVGEVRQTVVSGNLLVEVNTDADSLPELSVLLLTRTASLPTGDFEL